MAALEDGNDAVSLASGAATTLTVAMSLAGAGDNVIVSNFTHGGTFHQFKIITQRMGVSKARREGNMEEGNALLKPGRPQRGHTPGPTEG